MPRLSQWYVRTALAYLALGFTFGALMLANKGLNFEPKLWRLLPAHIELMLMGWTLQLALGMAFWMLPRFWEGPPRGNESGAWAAYLLLNLGVSLVILRAVFIWPSWLMFVGRAAEAGAAVAFGLHIWRRIVPRQ
jgi:hypothetical protein